jgi:dipeptidyl-peptidase-4
MINYGYLLKQFKTMNFKSLLASFILIGLVQVSIGQSNITLEEIWKDYKYFAKRVPGFNFMEDGKHYTRLENNKIKKYDLTTGKFVSDILDGTSLAGKAGFNGDIDSYTFNEDESLIMIESDKESIYRRSSKSVFHLYNRKDASMTPIYEEEKIQYATLSPDGSKVAYVWENNLYYLNLKDGVTLPVTTDGETNKIINGAADWVYEEEFSFAKAFFWSSDSKKIAFQRFDETEVPEFVMTKHNNDAYPEYVTFKYPKVGENNAVVTAHVYDIASDKTLDINIGDDEHYIPRLKWTNDPNNLFIYKMNRHQNNLKVISANTTTGATKTVIEENDKYYIDITDDIRFLDNNNEFIWSSEKSGYNHIYLYDLSGNEKRALTKGEYDVTSFYGINEKSKKVYYQAAAEGPLSRKVYSVDLRGRKPAVITKLDGTNSAQFSSTFDYYVNTNSTINRPANYTVYDKNSKVVRVIEDNKKLQKIQESKNVSPVEFFDFTTEENVQLNGWMIKPPNFDPAKKYPVFMYVYGGPGSQTVTDSWKGQNYWWFQMLAQQGYIVTSVDNRGTGARGSEFKKMTYQQLGHFETIDQLASAKYLGDLSYTDASRVGIFGWSYGGYMSSLALFKGNDLIKAGIAVAPVTNWKWYDSIYTERYMRTREENKNGYDNNSPINFVDDLKGNYLIMHGLTDDNVHPQNTMEMYNALIASNKQYDTYIYPNRNHGIGGNNARLHLYTKMTKFLNDKLKNGDLDNTPSNTP